MLQKHAYVASQFELAFRWPLAHALATDRQTQAQAGSS